MIDKLYGIGVRGQALAWFASYLSNRRQQTLINSNCVSEQQPVDIGLPQGSVLAPLLFLIYINDIAKVLEHCSIKLFADDALIMKKRKRFKCSY